MKIKSRFAEAFRLYFILVTLISILMMVVGMIFDRERTFGYEAFLSPLIFAAIGVIPTLFINPDKEISMKRMVVKHLVQLGIIEALVMSLVFYSDNIPSSQKSVVISVGVGIAFVYVITLVVEYIIELTQSKEMNKSLEVYQSHNEG